jgi:hypothetical protein
MIVHGSGAMACYKPLSRLYREYGWALWSERICYMMTMDLLYGESDLAI